MIPLAFAELLIDKEWRKAVEQDRDTALAKLAALEQTRAAQPSAEMTEPTVRGMLKSIDGYFVDHAENSPLHMAIKAYLYGDENKMLAVVEAASLKTLEYVQKSLGGTKIGMTESLETLAHRIALANLPASQDQGKGGGA